MMKRRYTGKATMSGTAPISTLLSQRILRHFDLSANLPPNLDTLRQLVERYTSTVPWESASRIVRRASQAKSADCILLGEAFWESHFARGAGGTCYESNYAFFGLLLRLGYEGYLTINDMGSSIGCHSAIVVQFNGDKYLVDVGFPLHAIIPLDPEQETAADSPFMRYTVAPLSDALYKISRDVPRFEPVFQLIDSPVCEPDYRAITCHDYRHDGGQFLDKVVIHRVVDGQLWRFNSDERPLRMHRFVNGKRHDHLLGDNAAGEIAAKFTISRDIVAEALSILDSDGN